MVLFTDLKQRDSLKRFAKLCMFRAFRAVSVTTDQATTNDNTKTNQFDDDAFCIVDRRCKYNKEIVMITINKIMKIINQHNNKETKKKNETIDNNNIKANRL